MNPPETNRVRLRTGDLPTFLLTGPYRIGVYSSDCREPMHVHVWRDQSEAKLWIDPVEVAWNRGFAPHELRRILKLVTMHKQQLTEKWDEYCE